MTTPDDMETTTDTVADLLARIAERAPHLIKYDEKGDRWYVWKDDYWRKASGIGGLDEDRILGAICADIEAKGWDWSSSSERHVAKQPRTWWFHVFSDRKGYAECSDQSPCHAALQAYEAALEAVCPKCGGSGEVVEFSYGRLPEHPEIVPCSECTGKAEATQ